MRPYTLIPLSPMISGFCEAWYVPCAPYVCACIPFKQICHYFRNLSEFFQWKKPNNVYNAFLKKAGGGDFTQTLLNYKMLVLTASLLWSSALLHLL